MRGATEKAYYFVADPTISIHAPHAGSDKRLEAELGPYVISIHAPHAGSDLVHFHAPSCCSISIHAPHAGSDRCKPGELSQSEYFNPRSPCGERPVPLCGATSRNHFNPRSPCGERHYNNGRLKGEWAISIHAPHAGSDFNAASLSVYCSIFQSTLPMRGATD